MYLEYHYVIAVILLSALIAVLLVSWRYKKQITEYSGLVSHLRGEKNSLERIVDIGASDFKEQAAVLEKAQEYNAQSESQVRHFQKTASTLKEDLAVEKTKHKVTLNEKDDAIFELNTLNNDRGVVIENSAKVIAQMQKDQNVLDGQIATQRKVIKEGKDAVDESLKTIEGLHSQIAAFKGKPVAIEKMKAVVRKIASGQHKDKYTVKLVDADGKTKWEYYHHTVLLTETAAQQAADRLNRTEVVIE